MDLVLCDDHPIVMQSMAAMFRAHGHEPVATASRPEELLDLVLEHEPHLCITDLLFDDRGPDAALEAITTLSPHVDIVVLSGTRGLTDMALAAGATAVASKALPFSEILALVEGRAPVEAASKPTDAPRPPYFLTGREVEVLQCLSEGDSTTRIAEGLGVRHATARSHVQSVLLKLGVHSRVAAVSLAADSGLIAIPA
jgi:two-component system nitrate/nitrite response regulator NarL